MTDTTTIVQYENINININNNNNQLDEMENSASTTTNSSIINGGGDIVDDSSNNNNNNNSSEFIFGIIKTEEKSNHNINRLLLSSSEYCTVTRQLFPEKTTNWLNLSTTTTTTDEEKPPVTITSNQNQNQNQNEKQVRKSRRGPRSRSSQYRGVTFYRRTGRWESHIWDCGKQVYLGGFDTAYFAARAYDQAAIKFRGDDADINFNLSDYDHDMKQMKHLSKEEFVHILRRQSNGFARGNSKYRGPTLQKSPQWQAKMGQFIADNTNMEHSRYGREMMMNTKFADCGHNLDLRLGISQPSTCHEKNDRPVLESYTHLQMAHSGLKPTSKHPLIWSGSLLNDEARATVEKKRVEGVPSASRFSNWAWKVNGNSMLPVSTVAASSGFQSLLSTSINSVHNLSAPNSTSSISNICHYYNT